MSCESTHNRARQPTIATAACTTSIAAPERSECASNKLRSCFVVVEALRDTARSRKLTVSLAADTSPAAASRTGALPISAAASGVAAEPEVGLAASRLRAAVPAARAGGAVSKTLSIAKSRCRSNSKATRRVCNLDTRRSWLTPAAHRRKRSWQNFGASLASEMSSEPSASGLSIFSTEESTPAQLLVPCPM